MIEAGGFYHLRRSEDETGLRDNQGCRNMRMISHCNL
jgi:hypothetical protein